MPPPWSPPLRPSPHGRAGRGERNNHNGVVRCRRGLGLASAFRAKRECMDVIEPAPVAGRERGTRFNGSSPWGPWVCGAEYRHGPALRSRPRLPRQIKHMILLIFCFQRVRSGPNVRPVTLLWTRAFERSTVSQIITGAYFCLMTRTRWTLETTEISGSNLPFHVNWYVFAFRTFITSGGRKHAMHVPPSRRTLG